VIVAEVPAELDHESVVDWPAVIVVAEAVKLEIVGAGETFTCTVLVTEPAPFVTVNV
jgi:hypothetical protein